MTKLSEEKINWVVGLVKCGKTTSEIADITDISKSTIFRIVKSRGLTLVKKYVMKDPKGFAAKKSQERLKSMNKADNLIYLKERHKDNIICQQWRKQ